MPSRPRFPRVLRRLLAAFVAAVERLDKSVSPRVTLERLRKHSFEPSDAIYIFHILLATFWLTIMASPGFPLKLLIPALYTIALLIPLTSQFFIPATPIFAWLLTFYSSRFIPPAYRPSISVSFLPTLESVFYGANISDILTRFTHPVLDIIAWLPYGVIHFILPFVLAAFIWLFRPKQALHLWARAFGYMNLIGVLIQIALPCAPPWYELIYGLTPANYGMHGSPGGLARIDALFHSEGYTITFSNAPVIFGAFPSLHAGHATIEALFFAHFFPQTTRYIWAYTGVLYWATMYLTHHYLIDVVAGACLATACFYLFLTDDLRSSSAWTGASPARRNKHEIYDLEAPRATGRSASGMMTDTDVESEVSSPRNSEEEDITYRSPNPVTAPHAFVAPQKQQQRKSHRHTASIASLIRSEDRVEDGWSPIGAGSFVFPPTPTRTERDREGEERKAAANGQ